MRQFDSAEGGTEHGKAVLRLQQAARRGVQLLPVGRPAGRRRGRDTQRRGKRQGQVMREVGKQRFCFCNKLTGNSEDGHRNRIRRRIIINLSFVLPIYTEARSLSMGCT